MVNRLFLVTAFLLLLLPMVPVEARRTAKNTNPNQMTGLRPGIPGLIQQALKLELTPEQKIKLKTVLDARDLKTKELQERSVSLMEEYLDMAVKPSSSKVALVKKNREVQSSYEALRAYQLETWLAIKGLLREEQLKTLEDKQGSSIAALNKTD